MKPPEKVSLNNAYFNLNLRQLTTLFQLRFAFFFFHPFTFNFGVLIPQILLQATSNWISFSLIHPINNHIISLTFIMIIGIFWLVSITLSWFLFVSLLLFLSPFLAVSCLFFCSVCQFYFLHACWEISTSLVFSLALYLNCLLLDFIQYFCIIKKGGTISFISTVCHLYVCTHTYTFLSFSLIYKNFCKPGSQKCNLQLKRLCTIFEIIQLLIALYIKIFVKVSFEILL